MSTTDLKPELRSIGKLFDESDTTYTIPIFQRNFAWQAAQIEQLISDIQGAMIDDRESVYFLGNLIVTPRKGKGDAKDFEVIDGQQRLTTLHLLLTSLKDAGASGVATHQDRLRYESRPRATEALRCLATEVARNAGASVHANEEYTGIHMGFNVIQQYIKQHINNNDLQKFADFLRDNVQVVRVSLPPKTDVNRYFEIMNTRGQQLQQVDIVKARLMGHLENDCDRACFAWIWDACADMESYVQMSLTRGNLVVRSQLFDDTWSWFTATSFDDLLKAYQVSKSDASTSAASSSELLTLDKALEKYAKSGAPSAADDSENVRFRSTIEFPNFLLHVLKIETGDDSEDEGDLDDKRLVKLFSDSFDTSQSVREFAFTLLQCRNLFDAFILKRQYTTTHSEGDGDWSLQRFIKKNSQDKETLDYVNTFKGANDVFEEDGGIDLGKQQDLLLIQSMLRVTFTSARTMHWIFRLLKEVKERGDPSTVKEPDLVELMRDYARGKVRETFTLDNPPSGFSINRIVFTYLDYLLLLKDNSNPKFKFTFRNSIEHFYPQQRDKQQYGDEVSEENLHLLGNLALVSVGANSKFSNSMPKAKAENFRATIEKQSPKLQEMAEITRQTNRWSDKEVKDHHNKMINLLNSDTTRDSCVSLR